MKGIIYKYTNLINDKIYIGQTIRPLEIRHKRHLVDSKTDDLYFHRALQKYGVENFKLEIIEEVEVDLLDEREKYWIKECNSHYLNGIGYNMTEGGRWGNAPRKLSDDAIKEIQDLLLNSNCLLIEICKEYDVSLSCISDINTGRTWRNDYYTYPIRKQSSPRKDLSLSQTLEIIDQLKNTNLSIKELSKLYNIYEYTVGSINRGELVICKALNYDFPIRKSYTESTYNNKLEEKDIEEIIRLFLFESKTQLDIANMYNLHKETIGYILRGKAWKEFTNQYVFPMSKHRKENIKIWNINHGIV